MPRRTAEQLAERDAAVLAGIREWDTRGFGPTLRELMDTVGLTSRASLAASLDRLKADGKVEWVPGKARTLRAVDEL